MTDSPSPLIPAANVEALRRLKDVETEWDAKLKQTRSEVAARVALSRDAAEKAIVAARAEMDRLREARLAEARTASQREAERIVADGNQQAQKLAAAASKGVAVAKDKILAAVLGEFQGSA